MNTSPKVYTFDDLVALEIEYNRAWKAAKSIEEAIEYRPKLYGEFNPRGLVDYVDDLDEDIPWIKEFFATCPNGKWCGTSYAVAYFELPEYARHPPLEGLGTIRWYCKPIGDIHIDIDYGANRVALEFVYLL